MLVVTGSDTRHLFYCRLVHHSAVMKFSPPGFAITIEPYRVRSAANLLQLLTRGNSQEQVVASPPKRQQPPQRTSQLATPAAMMTAIVQKAMHGQELQSGTVRS